MDIYGLERNQYIRNKSALVNNLEGPAKMTDSGNVVDQM